MPAVSVIVPVHNGAKHLASCLRSIVEQTLTDLEILVIDDGSTDDSAKIIAEFAAADPRVSCLPGPGLGSAGEARNVGLDRATGDYLSFLDADDFFAPTLLAELHAKAVADDADIAICKFRVYDERTEDANPVSWPLRLEYFPEKTPFSPDAAGDALFLATNPAAWNKLFRTDFVRRTGLRFQGLRRTNDAFFTYSALSQADRLTYLDEYLLSYRTGNAARPRTFGVARQRSWSGATASRNLGRRWTNVLIASCPSSFASASCALLLNGSRFTTFIRAVRRSFRSVVTCASSIHARAFSSFWVTTLRIS